MELVDDLDYRYCGEESVYMDVKEDPVYPLFKENNHYSIMVMVLFGGRV